LADVFDNQVVGDWRRDLATLIMMTPNLDWLLLTKRIGNAGAMLADMFPAGTPEHVWIGATIVNQEEADRDIPKLLDTPARVRFLSIEPLLGPVNVARYMWPIHGWWKGPYNSYREAKAAGAECGLKRQALVWAHARFIDWVIVGGESGPGARPMHPDWARSLRDQCAAAGVPFLFKQWGEWRPISQMADAEHSVLYRSRVKARAHEDQNVLDDIYGRDCSVPTGIVHNNGTLLNIDEPMACRHGSGAMQIFKVGKKAAGRLLDGIQHDGFPI
jgi:protein gp37